MRTHAPVIISLVALLITIACGGGGGTQTSPPPPPKLTVPTPTVLRTLYRVVNGTDRMTTVGPNERNSYPLEAQTYYVPDQSGSGQTVLNRVVNSSDTDHADTITSLSGYSQDMELGFPLNSGSAPGLSQLDEAYNSGTGDYALLCAF